MAPQARHVHTGAISDCAVIADRSSVSKASGMGFLIFILGENGWALDGPNLVGKFHGHSKVGFQLAHQAPMDFFPIFIWDYF